MVKNFIFGSLPESDSPAGTLNVLDFKKTLRGLVVAVAGAALVAGFDFLSGWLLNTDFGNFQILISFIISSGLIEIARRYLANHLNNVVE